MVIAKGCFAIKGQKAPSPERLFCQSRWELAPRKIFNAASKVH